MAKASTYVDSDVALCGKQGMKLQRVRVDVDVALLEEAKSLVEEGRRAGRKDWPESLSDLASAALRREIEALRSEVLRVGHKGRPRRA